jgi:hypothetical protein
MLPTIEIWEEAFLQASPICIDIGVDLPLPVPGCIRLLALIGYTP